MNMITSVTFFLNSSLKLVYTFHDHMELFELKTVGLEILHHSLCTIHVFILKQCLEYLWKYSFWLCFRILQYDASADDLRLSVCLQEY